MKSVQQEGLEGTSKLPICQKCFDKSALVQCGECGMFLCADCRKTHVCNKEDKKFKN